MEPAAFDRWWRNRINKEEADYVNHLMSPKEQTVVKLNTLGAPQVIEYAGKKQYGSAQKSSLQGSGVHVRKAEGIDLGNLGSGGSVAQDETRSTASGARTPKSVASYPKTPTFSKASGTDSEIAGRLARLEADLLEERRLREQAESTMKNLMHSIPPSPAP